MAATVVERLRRRERGAWEELYTAYEGRVYGFAYRLTGNPHDAADLTQETFVRVLSRLDRLEVDQRDLGSYLLTTTKNLFLDSLERRKRATPVESTPEPDDPVAIDEDPERAALLRRQREDVRRAVAELPERQRVVLALRELEDMSYAEVGSIAGLNENAAAQAIFRARQALRTRLRLGQVDEAALPAGCRERLPQLSAYLDGHLKGERLVEMEAHLAGCQRCDTALEDMREVSRRYRMLLPPLVLAPGLRERLGDAVEATGFWQSGEPNGAGATKAGPARPRSGLLARLGVPGGATAVIAAVCVGAAAAGAGALLLTSGGSDDDSALPGKSPAAAGGRLPTGGQAAGLGTGRTAATPVAGAGWARIGSGGLSNLTTPAVAVAGSDVVVAWDRARRGGARSSIEAVSFRSSPAKPVSESSRSEIVRNWRSTGSPGLVSTSDGSVRLLFDGLHSLDTFDPLSGVLLAERRGDGSWTEPESVINSVVVGLVGTPTALADGTPVFGTGVNEVYANVGTKRAEDPPFVGPGYFPTFAADGTGELWVARYADGLTMRRLDPGTGAPRGREHRAPAVDRNHTFLNEHSRLACNPAGSGCRLVYLGAGAFAGRLVSWAPGEPRPTVVARAAGLRDYDAAYDADGRLWVAWYDRGSADVDQGHYIRLGDERGRGGAVTFAGQPKRETYANWDLSVQPKDDGLVLVSNLEVSAGSEPAIWTRHVAADKE